MWLSGMWAGRAGDRRGKALVKGTLAGQLPPSLQEFHPGQLQACKTATPGAGSQGRPQLLPGLAGRHSVGRVGLGGGENRRPGAAGASVGSGVHRRGEGAGQGGSRGVCCADSKGDRSRFRR